MQGLNAGQFTIPGAFDVIAGSHTWDVACRIFGHSYVSPRLRMCPCVHIDFWNPSSKCTYFSTSFSMDPQTILHLFCSSSAASWIKPNGHV